MANTEEGSVEACGDVGPVAVDVFLHARADFKQPVGAYVFLADVFTEVAALERP